MTPLGANSTGVIVYTTYRLTVIPHYAEFQFLVERDFAPWKGDAL